MEAILMDGTVIDGIGFARPGDQGIILYETRDQDFQKGYVPREHLWAIVPESVDTKPPENENGS